MIGIFAKSSNSLHHRHIYDGITVRNMDVEVIMSVCQKAITLTDWGSEQCYISHVWKGLYIQIPITNQHNKAHKAVRVKIIFLLNYCQYCLHVFFLVKVALEYTGDSWVIWKLQRLKGRREKSCWRVWSERLDIISVPTFTFNRPDVMQLHHCFVTLERDSSKLSL